MVLGARSCGKQIKKETALAVSFCTWCEWGLVEDPLATLAHFEPHRFGAGFVPDPVQIAVEAGTIAAKQHHGESQNAHQQYINATKNNLSQGKGMKHDVTPYW